MYSPMNETLPTQRLTPSNAPNKRVEMKPLPIRIAGQQYERLSQHRLRTGISIQEHIRRAIDFYMDQVEREVAAQAAVPATPAPNPRSREPVRVRKR